jgi:hydroxymethylbilane synthase
MNPGLIIEEIRGNIVSRLEKLRANPALDGIILAKAGIDRAGFETPVQYEVLTPEIMRPAVGQGALAVEIRVDDLETEALIAPMNCPVTERAVLCEREFLRTLEGGCQVPIAGHAVIENGTITLTGMVASLDGKTMLKDIIVLPEDDFVKAGRVLAEKLLSAGADKILDLIYSGTMEK